MSTKFYDRLRALGFSSYNEYLNGDWWITFRATYRASKKPQNCLVCGCARVSLHHITYERLGDERLSDVVPLCDKHHEEVHRRLSAAGIGVGHSMKIISEIRQDEKIVDPKSVGKVKTTYSQKRAASRARVQERNRKRHKPWKILRMRKSVYIPIRDECQKIANQIMGIVGSRKEKNPNIVGIRDLVRLIKLDSLLCRLEFVKRLKAEGKL